MKALCLGFLTLIIFLSPLPIHAAADLDFMELREIEGSKIKEGVVRGVVEASSEKVWEVITDYEHYTDFMPRTKKAEVKERTAKRVIFFSYLNMPWPIKDVSYECEATFSSDHRSVQFQMVPETGKGVKQFQGGWKLDPVKGSREKTLLTYTLFFEPVQGYAPWLFDLGTKHSLAKVIKAVRKRVAHQKGL